MSSSGTVPVDAGFYGKLPSHGDFLRRRVSDAFVGAWDGWLQECLSSSRVQLGERWLDIYLTSPAWRFVCSAGACGPSAVAGVMVPSVDRVGRYFPLTLVAELPGEHPNVLATARRVASLLASFEQLAIETLDSDDVDFDGFDRALARLGQEWLPAVDSDVVLDETASAILDGSADAWQFPIDSPDRLGPALEQILARRLAETYDPVTLWWTEGSSEVQPSCLVLRGLPRSDGFVALLDGSWTDGGWRTVAEREPAGVGPDTLSADAPPMCLRSAAQSDVGLVRRVNQDSFLERPEAGIWAVADGLGGHSDGEVASRMVCDALASLPPQSGLEDLVEVVREQVGKVNDELVRGAAREIDPVQSGSTLVALLVRGTDCAAVWAGDSRAYRWRQGRLEQISRDHSLAEDGDVESHAITRAVGGDYGLELDIRREHLEPGDRFLLCSDGLYRMVSAERLSECLGGEDIAQIVQDLIAAALEGGGVDNVTALLVEAAG